MIVVGFANLHLRINLTMNLDETFQKKVGKNNPNNSETKYFFYDISLSNSKWWDQWTRKMLDFQCRINQYFMREGGLMKEEKKEGRKGRENI